MLNRHRKDKGVIGRGTVALVLLMAVGGLAPRVALAATNSYTDAVVALEVGATPTEGRFVGEATGRLPGLWYITVDHRPLSGTRPALITGGSVYLLTLLGGKKTVITGSFTSGSVVQASGFRGCTDQSFTVIGSLATVGVRGPGQRIGIGTFRATLTHHQTTILGRCVTYSASVTGGVKLTF
jgi:hypothetical protein